jgi:alcohol dehydrogenase, propanol-preferring
MLAPRMFGYKQPLVLEEVEVPQISSTQILVRVGGAGMCRSDVQLVDGTLRRLLSPNPALHGA